MTQPRILIVDDDEDLHILYSLYLQGQSMTVFQAFNGEEGLKILEKEKPDLVVLDMIMPIMDGEEFLNKLCLEKKILHIPVIIASVNEKIPERLLKLGPVYATLKKPFTIDILVAKVNQALKRSE